MGIVRYGADGKPDIQKALKESGYPDFNQLTGMQVTSGTGVILRVAKVAAAMKTQTDPLTGAQSSTGEQAWAVVLVDGTGAQVPMWLDEMLAGFKPLNSI